jgi:hypothetical protein
LDVDSMMVILGLVAIAAVVTAAALCNGAINGS